jgi:hypothetical protein
MEGKIKKVFRGLGKFFGATLVILIIVSIYKFFNISGLFNSEITAYPVLCKDKVVLNQCDNPNVPLSPTTFKVSTSRQEVVFWIEDFTPSRTTKCAIRDKKNWSCRYEDESGEFGFNNGVFREMSLDPKYYPQDPYEKYYYPSRTKFLTIKCGVSIPCLLLLNLFVK